MIVIALLLEREYTFLVDYLVYSFTPEIVFICFLTLFMASRKDMLSFPRVYHARSLLIHRFIICLFPIADC